VKEENIILTKTYDFGLRILKLYLHLRKNKIDVGLCSQLLNRGTSIGANVEETIGVLHEKILLINFKQLIKRPEKQNIG
jgi:four helix bundle protein